MWWLKYYTNWCKTQQIKAMGHSAIQDNAVQHSARQEKINKKPVTKTRDHGLIRPSTVKLSKVYHCKLDASLAASKLESGSSSLVVLSPHSSSAITYFYSIMWIICTERNAKRSAILLSILFRKMKCSNNDIQTAGQSHERTRSWQQKLWSWLYGREEEGGQEEWRGRLKGQERRGARIGQVKRTHAKAEGNV